jgi:hypothetical protein
VATLAAAAPAQGATLRGLDKRVGLEQLHGLGAVRIVPARVRGGVERSRRRGRGRQLRRPELQRGADHISYYDSEVGPNTSNDGMNWITAAYQTNDGASDVLLDGVDIHDFKKWNAGAHVDCIGIDDVDGLVIRNSRIWNCEHFSLIFGKDLWSSRASRNVVVENTFLDCCYSGCYSIGLGDVEGPMMLRFNSMTLGMGWLGGSVRSVTIDSNVIANNSSANCSSATWRYNVVASGSSCAQGTTAPTGFVAPPSDLHLRSGSAAIDFGNPNPGLTSDIDGQSRSGTRPDAGADETNGGGPTPTPTPQLTHGNRGAVGQTAPRLWFTTSMLLPSGSSTYAA